MRPLHEQLRIARERAGLTMTDLGRAIGWKDHTSVSRIEKGGPTNTGDLLRWVEATGHEIQIVPAASSGSVLARAHDANERELRIAASLLDLLVEFRDDPRAADYLERDITALRDRLRELRDLRTVG